MIFPGRFPPDYHPRNGCEFLYFLLDFSMKFAKSSSPLVKGKTRE